MLEQQLIQNSPSWHEWRNGGLGGSDSPVIMGVSNYSTPLQLWENMTGVKKPEEISSFVTSLGHKFEPVMRAQFELGAGYSIEPQCVEHSAFPWIRASLDGFNEEKRVFAEIKYIGEEKFNKIEKECKVPEDHFPQIQHQFLVTGFSKAFYLAYTLTEDRKKIDRTVSLLVEPDMEYIQNQLFPKLREFWGFVQSQTPPPLSDKDVKVVRKEIEVAKAQRYLDLIDQKKHIEAQIEEIKGEITSELKHPMTQIGDILKVTRVTKKGSVQYKNIPSLQGVELDEYRKEPTSYWKLSKS